jgi:UDP-N-acetylglucosamine acyltransferase
VASNKDSIHPTAIIHPGSRIGARVRIGAYSIVEDGVTIGDGTTILPRVYIAGGTMLGKDNVIHMGAVIGHEPQLIGFAGEETPLRIGDRNVLREQCEVHRASKAGGTTVIGDDNYLMSHSHVGHDCRIGNRVIVAPGVLLGGHVEVGDQVFLSGNCVVHQYVRIGRLALLRGLSRTSRDVPPFCLMDGTHTVRGLNRVGLRRAGMTAEQIGALQRAFVRLFRRRANLAAALAEIEREPPSAEVAELVEFIRASRRGVCSGPAHGPSEAADEDQS